jgi:hypothetical protein
MNAYQSFRHGRAISGPSITARNGEALTLAEIARVVPSVFATEAHDSRSDRFIPIPTASVVEGLMREGFEVFAAAQSRTRDADRREFTKHMLRLRHRGTTNLHGHAFEVILTNANDGTAAYSMLPGFFRFVCFNGLAVGERFSPVKVRHSGRADQVAHDVIEGAYTVLGERERVTEGVRNMSGIALTDQQAEAFAEAAHMVRFPDQDRAPVSPRALLAPRRAEDRATDLWTTFNRVQENCIRGGQRGVSVNETGQRRRVTTREVRGLDQNTALNRALWTLADRMADLARAA